MPAKEILQCGTCKQYTLHSPCSCGGTAITPKPAKYSLEDKYGKYRAQYKAEHNL